MRSGTLTSKHCDCGHRVIEVAEADELLRAKGKLPPITMQAPIVCEVCDVLGIDPDHKQYDNPQMGDEFHGQYDPEHPEELDAYAQRQGS
jgi:hypothetical protein